MTLLFKCPHCGTQILVKHLKVGEEALCRGCQRTVVVPDDAARGEDQSGASSDVLPVGIAGATGDSSEAVEPVFQLSCRYTSLGLHLLLPLLLLYLWFGTDLHWTDSLQDVIEIPIIPVLFLLLLVSGYVQLRGTANLGLALTTWIVATAFHGLLAAVCLYAAWNLLLIAYFPWPWLFTVGISVKPKVTWIILGACAMVLVAFSGGILWATNPVRIVKGAEGTLVIVKQNMVIAYDLATGHQREVMWAFTSSSGPLVLCKGPSNSILLKGSHALGIGDSLLPADMAGANSALYRYVPLDDSVELMQGDLYRSESAHSLDYYEPTRQYLVLNPWSRNRSMFLLDSTLTFSEDLEFVLKEQPRGARFIDSVNLLIWGDDSCRCINLVDSSRTFVTSGTLKAISHDRNWIVTATNWSRSGSYDKNEWHTLVNIKTGEEIPLEACRFRSLQCCFSPDDTKLVFKVRRFNLTDSIVFFVYDIETGKLTKIDLRGRGSVIWVKDRFVTDTVGEIQ